MVPDSALFSCRPARRWRLVPLLLTAALGGCEAMREMDALDRVFEPERFRVAQPLPPPVPIVPPQAPPAPLQASTPDAPLEPTQPTGALAGPSPIQSAAPSSAPIAEPEPDPPAFRTVQAAEPSARGRPPMRQQPWMTRFWAQLTPPQRARVETRLRRRDGVPSDNAPMVWDSMGLSDRVRLAADDAPNYDPGSATGADR